MTDLVKFDVGNGETILVEVDDVASDEIQPAAKRPGEIAIRAARKTLSEALDDVAPMIRMLKDKLNTFTESADEVEVKFSVKLSAEVGAVVTKISGEATYEITLKWANK